MQLLEVLEYLKNRKFPQTAEQEVLGNPYLTEYSRDRIRGGGLDAMLRQLEQIKNQGVDLGRRRDTINSVIEGM